MKKINFRAAERKCVLVSGKATPIIQPEVLAKLPPGRLNPGAALSERYPGKTHYFRRSNGINSGRIVAVKAVAACDLVTKALQSEFYKPIGDSLCGKQSKNDFRAAVTAIWLSDDTFARSKITGGRWSMLIIPKEFFMRFLEERPELKAAQIMENLLNG